MISHSRSKPNPASDPEPQTMAELLKKYGSAVKTVRHGQVVEGKVFQLGKREILLDIGTKAEGIITGRELEDEEGTFGKIAVGDTLLAYVVQPENEQGYVVLSLRRAGGEKRWRALEEAQKEKKNIVVKAVEYNRGGLVVDAGGIRGFIPLSHLDIAHLSRSRSVQSSSGLAASHASDVEEKLARLVGLTLEVRVIEINRLANRFVLSEKEAVFARNSQKRVQFLKTLKTGEIKKGIVTRVAPYGLFVDVGGVEGLVHVSELSWGRVFSPGALYQPGDSVEVKILAVEESEGRIVLSIRALRPDPWLAAAEKYKVGDQPEGIVTKIAPFGVFVQIEEGLDGLVHSSSLPETVKETLKEGQKIKAKIVSINPSLRRLSLVLGPVS